jgi:hypothetical protein
MNDQYTTVPPSAGCHLSPVDALIELLKRPLAEITWVRFVPTFESWCTARGWGVEYNQVEDESLAIFCQADGWHEEESQP